jgi:hypothetical protein
MKVETVAVKHHPDHGAKNNQGDKPGQNGVNTASLEIQRGARSGL